MKGNEREAVIAEMRETAAFRIAVKGEGKLETQLNDWADRLASIPGEREVVALVGPIERDESINREYIPMPAGWEVQTKGKGSTFRLSDSNGERRLAIPDEPYLHETLTAMAREINAACAGCPAPAVAAPVVTEAMVDRFMERYFSDEAYSTDWGERERIRASLTAALERNP